MHSLGAESLRHQVLFGRPDDAMHALHAEDVLACDVKAKGGN